MTERRELVEAGAEGRGEGAHLRDRPLRLRDLCSSLSVIHESSSGAVADVYVRRNFKPVAARSVADAMVERLVK